MRSTYGIVRRETSTLSSDGRSWLRIMVWLPDPTYTRRGAVQLIHGMAEHIGRYDQFARFLAGLGYVVFGHDHIGHGESVSSSKELGHMPLEGGKEILLQDVARVREVVFTSTARCDDLPLFLFGHSMGSYVARVYIARTPKQVAGAVLCGTGHQPRALALAGRSLSKLIGAVRGPEYRSSLVESLVIGSFSSAISNSRTEYDWLSNDPEVVDTYCADPLSGFRFSVGGYATLMDLVAEAVSKTGAAEVPSSMPLLFIAGEEDPVGSWGKAVQKAAELYRQQGVQDVSVILYPDMRHEILNEPDRMRVFSDVESWLTKRAILRSLQESESHSDSENSEEQSALENEESN